jgi:hypothetical protein
VQHSQLVTQEQDLDVLAGVGTSAKRYPELNSWVNIR